MHSSMDTPPAACMHVCMCVICMYVCMPACMCACRQAHIFWCTNAYIHTTNSYT